MDTLYKKLMLQGLYIIIGLLLHMIHQLSGIEEPSMDFMKDLTEWETDVKEFNKLL